ncbi:MAG: hypothetical protein WB392_11590 [Methanotrichaceae archaeon]
MKCRLLILALVYGLLLAACYAQPTAEFQSVNGDFARSWLNGFLAQNPQRAENKSGDLWSWGGVPLGYMLVNGELVPIQNGTTLATNSNSTVNWLGDTYINPYVGTPLYNNGSVVAEPYYEPTLPLAFNSNDPWA